MEVMIKFGPHHGLKGQVIRETTKKGEPAYIIAVKGHDGFKYQIIKRQKNTVKMLPVNK